VYERQGQNGNKGNKPRETTMNIDVWRVTHEVTPDTPSVACRNAQ